MAGGIGGSGMATQNMGLSNLAPSFSMNPESRQMLAMALMQNQMRRQPDGPLGALAGLATMYAAGKTTTDAGAARDAQAQSEADKERQRQQQRLRAAQGTLSQLGQTLYGGRNMDGYDGLIDPDDPYGGLQAALALRARQEPPRAGAGPRDSWPVSGISVQYDPDTGEPFQARFNARTGEYERIPGAGIPINSQSGLPYDPIPPRVAPGSDAAPSRGIGGQIMDWWRGGSAPQAGTTGPASPATVPATGGPTPVPTGPVAAGNPPPPGIPPEIWAEMTPDERAAFQ